MKQSALKEYTAVVKIGDGSQELGLFHVTLTVEANNSTQAKKNALKVALSSTFVTVETSEGRNMEPNEVFSKTFGSKFEEW